MPWHDGWQRRASTCDRNVACAVGVVEGSVIKGPSRRFR